MYKEMLMRGIRSDEIAFVSVISALLRRAILNWESEYFASMTLEYRLNALKKHYICLLHRLSRADELDKVWNLGDEMLFCKGHVVMLQYGVCCYMRAWTWEFRNVQIRSTERHWFWILITWDITWCSQICMQGSVCGMRLNFWGDQLKEED